MKRFLIILILFFVGNFVSAEMPILKSASGVIENIEYEDTAGPERNEVYTKQLATVKVTSGDFKGTRRIVDNILTGNPAYDINLSKGDRVILHLEPTSEIVATSDDVDFFVADMKRDNSLLLFAGIFGILLIIIGKKKGAYSLFSIIATAFLIFSMFMPLVLNGVNPILTAVVVATLSTVITIYSVGGRNAKSTSAVIGTFLSLVIAGIFSIVAINVANLTGFAGEENLFLYAARPDMNFKGLLSASMIIAALGALMDTAISIASTVNEIFETDRKLSMRELFDSGMNVGRDVIGTMSNTLILVYLGASLPLVLLSSNIDLNKFFNLNQVATEISAALIGSIGILACVPITAIVSAYLIKRFQNPDFNFGNAVSEIDSK